MFKIRPTHISNFENLPFDNSITDNKNNENDNDNYEEESVFVIDDETGEIKEEKQFVKSTNKTNKGDKTPNKNLLPKKEAPKQFALSMRKVNMTSFM